MKNPIKRYFHRGLIITILVCVAFGCGIYYLAALSLEDSVEHSMLQVAKTGAQLVSTHVTGELDLLATMASTGVIVTQERPMEEKMAYLHREAVKHGYKRISLVDVNGQAMSTDGPSYNIRDLAYFQKMLGGQRLVTSPHYNRADGEMAVLYGVPIVSDGQTIGVLLATRDSESLSRITDTIRIDEKGNSYIIDNSGVTIAHDNRRLIYEFDNDFENVKQDPNLLPLVNLERNMTEGKSGAGEYTYQGIRKIMGYYPIEGTTWSLAVTAPQALIYSSANRVLYVIILSLGVAAVVFLILYTIASRLRDKLRLEEQLAMQAIDAASILVLRIGYDGTVLTANSHFWKHVGPQPLPPNTLCLFDLVATNDETAVQALLNSLQQGQTIRNLPLAIQAPAGQRTSVVWSARPVHDEWVELIGVDITDSEAREAKLQSQNTELSSLYEELTALYQELSASEEEMRDQYERLLESEQSRSASEERVRRLAYFDLTTELPNRTQLQEYVANLLAKQEDGAGGSLLFLDIDNFKVINDTYGHEFGDRLLKEVAKRLTDANFADLFVARLGGDEFLIVSDQRLDQAEIHRLPSLILELFRSPMTIDGREVHLSVSIGLALYPEHGNTLDKLMKSADTAMYHAKANGRNCAVVFRPEMETEIEKKLTLSNGLKTALDRGQIQLYYQPQIDVESRKIVGFEALMRWRTPQQGFIPPNKFIPIAEESGLINDLGRWALTEACQFAANLSGPDQAMLISVNVSPVQLRQPNFVEDVSASLAKSGLAPERLELEITETAILDSFDTVKNSLMRLRDIGVRISLDDFGTGYSSLNYLRQLPIQRLKIDKIFVQNMETNAEVADITRTVIALAHRLGLDVVGEGVETVEQLNLLAIYGCDIIQGYLFFRPVEQHTAVELLRSFPDNYA